MSKAASKLDDEWEMREEYDLSHTYSALRERKYAMYGLIGKMAAVAGRRDELVAILLEGTQAMPGCLSYVIATDPAEPDALWITEVWESQESHRASLALPPVQAAIAKGRPLIAGMGNRVETKPLGGHGLSAAPE